MCTTAAALYPKASCQNFSQAAASAAMLCSCKRTIAYQFKPALVMSTETKHGCSWGNLAEAAAAV